MTLSELRPLIDLDYEVYETTFPSITYSHLSVFGYSQVFSNDWQLVIANDTVKTEVLASIATKDADSTFKSNQSDYDKLQKANEMLYKLD